MKAARLFAILAALFSVAAGATGPGDFVDPLIGTAHEGQTFPGVGVPFGMTQWTPQTRDGEAKCVSPYYFKDDRIEGFRGTHWWSGSCTQDYGSVTIMPETGPVKTGAVARSSRFRHDREQARPWHYSVTLDDYGIDAEVTGSSRAGYLRFRFPATARAAVVIQPNSHSGEGEIHIDPAAREIYGANPVHRLYAGSGKLAGFSGYFVARFDHPFSSFGTWSGAVVHESSRYERGNTGQPGAFVRFQLPSGGRVGVQVGTSFTSIEEARRNLNTEMPDWDFQRARNASQALWNQALSQIEIRGASPDQQRIFYTALYHALQMPRTFSDVSGTYPGFGGEGKLHTASGFIYYDDFSLWDTFRALHPLLTILDPKRSADMAESLVVKGQQGGWIPVFPGWSSYTSAMIGDHDVAMIVDAYRKGIRGFDVQEAYRLMLQNATKTPPYEQYVDGKGRRALAAYLQYGYIPLEDPVREAFHRQEQVSRTLEYAYDDFVLAQLAKALGHENDYRMLMHRSLNYRNVFDPSVGFVRGRHRDGSWDRPFDPAGKYLYITEGLPWQYTFFVPQDIPGLMALMGGRQAFTRKLDELFAGNYYDHGNEPSHQIAYLYDYAGEAWKTQQHVRSIQLTEYSTGPDGLSGNDDCGQISAWYILSTLGFYPVCPGVPYYEIGSPQFPEAIVHLAGHHDLTIRARGASAVNRYIQSASWDGKPFTKTWLAHADLVQGGALVLQMGPEPNKTWGSQPNDAPPTE
ncbi:MAG TPA: GH92 family glycosyl hydrolase [Bryobacteraceae bacterium]|nr:GH92 family glycosyl hydrolase [Bryobacteraceae bacterium]